MKLFKNTIYSKIMKKIYTHVHSQTDEIRTT